MRSNAVSSGQSGLASQYNNLRADAYGGSELLAHEQGTPNMTLYVEPGAFYINGTRVIFGGGNSPTITAPTSHPRIDILTIDSSGTLAITQGTEASSPVVPSYPSNKVVLCEIYNRVGETSVKDADDSTNGYIYNDVRPILEYPINPAAIASDMIPDVADTRDLGSSGTEWNNVYAKTIYQSGKQAAFAQFGGTGADGALSITSGTTTINLGGASYYEKNYSSISITGTGQLTFSNPSSNGCVVVLKSTGDVTITSSASPAILGDGLGASADSDGFGLARGTKTAHNISIGVFPGGAGGSTGEPYCIGAQGANVITGPFSRLSVFSGSGGQVASGGNNHGAGGPGGLGISIECAGALNFTGTITSNGSSGANGSGGTSWSGWYTKGAGGAGQLDNSDSGYSNLGSSSAFTMGGGGGGGGSVVILYNTLTANTGTITVSGGTGGTGNVAGQAGSAGFYYVGQNTVFT